MPHMCTRCKRVFEDGMDVLEGCPVCGWKKFLFVKSKDKIREVRSALKASEIGGPYEPWPEGDDSLRKILKAGPRRDREGDRPKDERRDGKGIHKAKKSRPVRRDGQDQRAKGKLGFVDLDTSRDQSETAAGRSDKDRHDEDKTLESIRMSEPGSYELNLPSLFEREELVMAVKEGTYLIDLSSAFKKSKKE
ncbi:OapC/ArvC family zinc-ribbon domain-containing protein [Candidatus Methanocrinis alkalitolerans]|nr:Zn-ribbon containing protein [Candidatus Methanocrinis alkalitolerans]